jgi:hypothetical protein
MGTGGVPMAVAPVNNDLEEAVEWCQGGVAAGEEMAPDDRLPLAWPPIVPLA